MSCCWYALNLLEPKYTPSCCLLISFGEAERGLYNRNVLRLSINPSIRQSITLSCPLHFSESLKKISEKFRQMIILVSLCAETMTQLCRINVKVTVQGHSILPLNFVSTPYLYLLGDFRLVHRNETVCRVYDLAMQSQGQSHN